MRILSPHPPSANPPVRPSASAFYPYPSPSIANAASSPIIMLGKKFSRRQRWMNHSANRNGRGKSVANISCRTCMRYGCHLRSNLVILLKPEHDIATGLRLALTSHRFCSSRVLTAAMFCSVHAVLRLPELPLLRLRLVP